jgi:asparagine synthase (glutamine-hydrolysing)
MCGIAGVLALPGGEPASEALVSRMCDTIIHRGPDAEGLWAGEGVGLGARRLAIIDLAGGDQPLTNEDGSVVLVFNGEIYNYRELRQRLLQRGHALRTQTDGEVLAHLWEDEGSAFLSSVNGMFALALFDRRARRVVLARDRIGIKPLYYARLDHHVVFGSEPKALLASGLVPRELDFDALRQFLTWEYVPAPATLFRAIRKLEPAQRLEISLDTGTVTASRYWDVPLAPADGEASRTSDGEWEEALAAQIGESVRRQLVSDVPLGALLSGGVDSSTVVADMGPVSTFSIGFDDPSYNELPWARRVAEHLGVPHTSRVIEPHVAELFGELMPFLDDPIGDFSIFPTYLVSRLARSEVTVALSGDGGDELFGGYDSYRAELLASRYARLPGLLRRVAEAPVRSLRPSSQKRGLANTARRFVEGLAYDERLHHARWRLFLDPERPLFTNAAARVMSAEPAEHIVELFRRAGPRGALDRMLYVDLGSYLPENCLHKVDRMSMACSLEVRVPLLDHELVELAFRMPERLKIRGRRAKVALKRVAARRVPRECVYRRKEGFSIPIKNWLRSELEPLMRDLLSPDRIRADGLFDEASVGRLVDEHVRGEHNHSHLIWSLMVFHDWQRRWLS